MNDDQTTTTPLSAVLIHSQEDRDALMDAYENEPEKAAATALAVLRYVNFDERKLTMRSEVGACFDAETWALFNRATDLHDDAVNVEFSAAKRRSASAKAEAVSSQCQQRCAECPLMAVCLTTAVFKPSNNGTGGVDYDEFGVWGGTLPEQRAEINRVLADEEFGELRFQGELAVRGLPPRLESYDADELVSDLGRSLDEIDAEDAANRKRFATYRTDYNLTEDNSEEDFDIHSLLDA